ncbi:MAG TPA: hypothetical protein P5072_01740, partial [Parvularculaceae bacterium]|nr:hypothetical protein [Parvularculaceae bacterium]
MDADPSAQRPHMAMCVAPAQRFALNAIKRVIFGDIYLLLSIEEASIRPSLAVGGAERGRSRRKVHRRRLDRLLLGFFDAVFDFRQDCSGDP